MKKTVISVLIVLLLSFTVLGCGDQPCEVCGAATKAECICQAASASALTEDVIKDLPTGITAADVLTPLGTKLHAHKKGGTNNIVILWKDANQAMFEHYEKAWKANERAVQIGDYSAFTMAVIEFYAEAGTVAGWDLSYPAGTIYFMGQKN